MHVSSRVAVSANPRTRPVLVIVETSPLFPPSVGTSIRLPLRQTNERQIRWVPKPHQSSPRGSGVVVSAPPTVTSPTSFMPPTLAFGPPSVPRSCIFPSRQRNGWKLLSPATFDVPSTQPMLFRVTTKQQFVPPSEPRFCTV